MVIAEHERTAAPHLFDHVRLPQGQGVVERLAGQLADEREQRRLIVRCRQGDVVQVAVDVEAGHFFPGRRGQRPAGLDHPLPETLEVQQAPLQHAAHPGEAQRLAGQRDHCDDRGVGRAVHVVPGRIDGIERVHVPFAGACHSLSKGRRAPS